MLYPLSYGTSTRTAIVARFHGLARVPGASGPAPHPRPWARLLARPAAILNRKRIPGRTFLLFIPYAADLTGRYIGHPEKTRCEMGRSPADGS